MAVYYLADQGFPYQAVVTETEARALFEEIPAGRLIGTFEDGYTYATVLGNGRGERVLYFTKVSPIAPEDLDSVVRRVGRLTGLPPELARCS
jgi:hypothetical protein